jgi:hypothetical protein
VQSVLLGLSETACTYAAPALLIAPGSAAT